MTKQKDTVKGAYKEALDAQNEAKKIASNKIFVNIDNLVNEGMTVLDDELK